jgi:hypothetical protein
VKRVVYRWTSSDLLHQPVSPLDVDIETGCTTGLSFAISETTVVVREGQHAASDAA